MSSKNSRNYRFLATFPAGTYPIIARQLKGFGLDELKLVGQDESSVMFDSSLTVERLIELRYFTNLYLLISPSAKLPNDVLKGKYFRLMLLKNGRPEPLVPAERALLERQIGRDFGLQSGSHNSRNDFYVIERTGGKPLLGLRLPRAKFKRDRQASGQLRPELAHILCLAAGLKAKHSLVDMFAGYGGIPLEAVRGFGAQQVLAVDNQQLPKRQTNPNISWRKADARQLDFIASASIDRVITDPPWGLYDAPADALQSLYQAALTEIARILKHDGVAVILTAYDQVQPLLEGTANLKIINHWPILVSGKKSTIYKLQKVI